jgi:hypothetical protein
MNTIPLTALGSTIPLFYQCADCGAVYHPANRGVADQCCSPAMTRCVAEGCNIRRDKGKTFCATHCQEHIAKRAQARWDKAELVEVSEQVTNGDGDYWDSVESYRDELDVGTPAHFLWGVERVHLKVDADQVISRLVENWWNTDDCDSPDLSGVAEFTAACLQFQNANAHLYLYEPNYAQKLAVEAVPEDDEATA